VGNGKVRGEGSRGATTAREAVTDAAEKQRGNYDVSLIPRQTTKSTRTRPVKWDLPLTDLASCQNASRKIRRRLGPRESFSLTSGGYLPGLMIKVFAQ
jgi:hypothetical protein